jgi:excisionase family DNA binding protein
MSGNENYLTINEVSEKLILSKSSLYNYVKQNKIPYIKLGGKLLFSTTDLQTWIDSKKTAAK